MESKNESFDECDLDDLGKDDHKKKSKDKKDIVDELFGDDKDKDDPKLRKKCKIKDEFDELYEQSLGDGEDIYASGDFATYDDGVPK